MKVSTTAAAAAACALLPTAHAFAGPSRPAAHRRQAPALTMLPLDPTLLVAAASSVDSTSVVTANALVDGFASCVLVGSIGLSVLAEYTGAKDGSEALNDLVKRNDKRKGQKKAPKAKTAAAAPAAKKEETAETEAPAPVSGAKRERTKNQRSFFSLGAPAVKAPAPKVPAVKAPAPKAPAVKAPAARAPAAKAPAPPSKALKANAPSKTVLASAESAKVQVQKVGVEATLGKMAAKAEAAPTPPAATATATAGAPPASTAVAEAKKPGGKRRAAKGLGLVLAAGAVALARNAVRAYLGRGLL